MARDIEASVKVKDDSKAGLDSVERRFRESGQKIEKEYDRFGKSAGDRIMRGVGAISPMLAKRLSSAFGDAASLGAPLLLSGIGAALPALSALVGAAVTGGAAGLGIVGGVAIATRDARVKAAGTQLGATLLAGLQDRAGSFIEPVLGSIEIMENAFERSGDKIENIFENSAKFVEPLAETLAGVGENLIDGLDLAVSRAGPVMSALNEGLEGTGEAIEGFIDDVTQNSTANAAVLEQTFQSLNSTITLTGETVGGLADVFGFLNSIMPLSAFTTLNEVVDRFDGSARRTGGGTFEMAGGFQAAGDAAETAAADTQLYEKALRENASAAKEASRAQSSLFSDTTAVGAAMDEAKEAVRRNGQTLSAHTEKGRANRTALSQLAERLNAYRGNLEKSGATTTQVNGTLNSQRAALIRVATQMTGNARKARQLADELLGIPKKTDTKSNLNTQKAKAEAQAYKNDLGSIPRNISTTVTVNVNASRLASVERRLARAAAGEYAGGSSFGLNLPGQLSRVGGPLQLTSTVENYLSIDGGPFRKYVDNRVRTSEARQRHRQRYGGKHW